jgi:hypothetical protein
MEKRSIPAFAGFQLAIGHLELISSHVVFWACPLCACTTISIEN